MSFVQLFIRYYKNSDIFIFWAVVSLVLFWCDFSSLELIKINIIIIIIIHFVLCTIVPMQI